MSESSAALESVCQNTGMGRTPTHLNLPGIGVAQTFATQAISNVERGQEHPALIQIGRAASSGELDRIMVRLEIAGGIGAGKTTLARVLAASWNSGLVHENVLDVPFFSKFYAAPQTYGFEKNISFLLSHADLIRDSMRGNGGVAVCDFALFQDLSYTDVGCSLADAGAVEGIYHRLIDRVGHPSLVVHLRCTPDTQLRRIALRGRSQEAGIERGYLVDLCAAIDRRLEQLRSEAPGLLVIEVDTDEVDYATNPAAAQAIARELTTSLKLPTEMIHSPAGAAGNPA
jgi:deoxyadenosine/deoxycytidine kinase